MVGTAVRRVSSAGGHDSATLKRGPSEVSGGEPSPSEILGLAGLRALLPMVDAAEEINSPRFAPEESKAVNVAAGSQEATAVATMTVVDSASSSSSSSSSEQSNPEY